MSWCSRKKKEGIFCTVCFVRRDFFFKICFMLMYSALNTLSEYIYFYITKTLLHTLLLLILKIVESLQSILKFSLFEIVFLSELNLNDTSGLPE